MGRWDVEGEGKRRKRKKQDDMPSRKNCNIYECLYNIFLTYVCIYMCVCVCVRVCVCVCQKQNVAFYFPGVLWYLF